jgi:hypothetical protein
VIRSEKKLKELAGILKEGDAHFIARAIKSLRGEEPIEGAIGLLTEYYDNSSDEDISGLIENFFNDIKHHSARPEVMAEIRKPWKQDTLSMLVSSCWQSGQDYSEYTEDIATVFLEADYSTAIECMTVMEESAKFNTREQKDNIIEIIKNSSRAFTHEKTALTHELIGILEQ